MIFIKNISPVIYSLLPVFPHQRPEMVSDDFYLFFWYFLPSFPGFLASSGFGLLDAFQRGVAIFFGHSIFLSSDSN